MSRIGLPLDDPMLQRLERSISAVEPDPLFRRRLRGEVVNRHVATREGLVRAPRRQREMGRLGRATLYASLAVALSVSAAGAASQGALPGDALYSVKLQLEEIRMRIAPPSLRDDLAAMALEERLDEVEALAAEGAWSRIAGAAAGVAAAEDRLAGYAGIDADDVAAIHRHTQVLEALLATAPASARGGLETALQASAHAGHDGDKNGTPANGGQAGDRADGDQDGPQGQPAGGNGGSASPETSPSQHPTAQPAPSQSSNKGR